MNHPDYTSLIALIKTLILISGGLIAIVTAGTALLMYKLYNVFTTRKEFKEELEKIDIDLRAHRDNHNKLMIEIKTHEIFIQQLKESMKEQFANQQTVLLREMQHLSNNIKQQSQNSAKAIETVMKLEDRMDRMEKKN